MLPEHCTRKTLVLEIASGNAIGMDTANSDEGRDPMGPPAEPCECFCLHCRRVFMSDMMWFQRVINARDGFKGFWLCPTPNCGGAGFTMDIFPTDPDHPANAGWHSSDEEEIEEGEEEWDPAESKFEEFEDEDDDIEGEEWKLGIRPDELPVVPQEPSEAQRQAQLEMQREREEEEKRHDMPDERPRVVDWSNREDPPPPAFGEDAIPF
jgi:hypothetical protein